MKTEQVRYVIKEGQRKLEAAGKESSAFDARALLSFVAGIPFSKVPLHYGDELPEEQQAQYEQLIERRIDGEPLQYITGEQEFMGLTFHVDPRVLIPRLDTEILAEEAVGYVNDKLSGGAANIRVLDLCCGSGTLGLSIAKLAGSTVVLADISEDALDVARENAETLGVAEKVTFVQSDLFENVQGVFDLIVCNPPYIRSDVIPMLDEEVRGHEPVLALDGGADGLDIYRRIAEEAPCRLRDGGRLMLEIGFDQAEDVANLLEPDFQGINTKKDLAGFDRVVSAMLK